MPADRGAELIIDGQRYNLVLDHDTYVVTDVPTHADADTRMERRVTFDDFSKGIQKRREAKSVDTTTGQLFTNFNRLSRVAEGIWWGNGCDTRMGDRVFGQRATYGTTIAGGGNLLSRPLFAGDLSAIPLLVTTYSYILCEQHAYAVTIPGVPPANQTITLAKDLGALVGATYFVTDAIAFNGKLFVAMCQKTNGILDYTKYAPFVQWDGTSVTTNWVQAPPPFVPAVTPAPVITNVGTTGNTQWQYYVVASDGTRDSVGSTAGATTTGNNQLSATNYNVITWTAAAGATKYEVFRQIVGTGAIPSTIGLIGTVTAPTVTLNDTGQDITGTFFSRSPGYAAGDVGNASCFAVIRNTLWRAAGSKMWFWSGQLPTWSAEITVGDPTTVITGLDVYQDGLVIFKQDGIYTMDRGQRIFPLFPGFRTLGFNPRPLGQWRGSYYFASDIGMVWEWDGNSVNRVGFDSAEAYPFSTGGFGIPNAATRGMSMPNYFVVGYNRNTTTNEGYFLAYDSVAWHPFRFERSNQVSGLGMTGGNQVPSSPVLQFGMKKSDNSAYSLSYMDRPTLDPFLVTSFDTIAQDLYLPIDNGIISDEYKILETFRAYVENSTSGTVRLAYAIDDNISSLTFTDLGAPVGDQTAVQTFLPNWAELPPYRKLLIRVRITPSTSVASPIIRSLVQRYKQREPQRKAWEIIVFLEEGQLSNNRNRLSKTTKESLKKLNEARKNSKLVTFTDIIGDKYMVYVESVGEAVKSYRNMSTTTSFVCKIKLVEPVEMPLGS